MYSENFKYYLLLDMEVVMDCNYNMANNFPIIKLNPTQIKNGYVSVLVALVSTGLHRIRSRMNLE
jgi:hypothetical protein